MPAIRKPQQLAAAALAAGSDGAEVVEAEKWAPSPSTGAESEMADEVVLR